MGPYTAALPGSDGAPPARTPQQLLYLTKSGWSLSEWGLRTLTPLPCCLASVASLAAALYDSFRAPSSISSLGASSHFSETFLGGFSRHLPSRGRSLVTPRPYRPSHPSGKFLPKMNSRLQPWDYPRDPRQPEEDSKKLGKKMRKRKRTSRLDQGTTKVDRGGESVR
ncbi:hypothetical protein B296_00021099 [Ensete ventricosum]|uniref:Uncharacterized protein n=1 Tax=Ensete ventricosum TaxID=4639 RepID=A0A426Z1L2_ENSVE|nr:hypothetical protein B296_00021099 [Ensete ventricosum]